MGADHRGLARPRGVRQGTGPEGLQDRVKVEPRARGGQTAFHGPAPGIPLGQEGVQTALHVGLPGILLADPPRVGLVVTRHLVVHRGDGLAGLGVQALEVRAYGIGVGDRRGPLGLPPGPALSRGLQDVGPVEARGQVGVMVVKPAPVGPVPALVEPLRELRKDLHGLQGGGGGAQGDPQEVHPQDPVLAGGPLRRRPPRCRWPRPSR
ncbi:MAG: hypothetical protein MZV63_13330 [Marinilabiliales bacterium]|nr:hypothetical protein [Marinilabiliales bacterium]